MATKKKLVDQYMCPSYYNKRNKLVGCKCGKCAITTKAKALDKAIDTHNKKSFEDRSWQAFWDAIPDSEATVEQVKNAGKWLGLEEPKTNYWKYACIAILLGIVVAMILSTPTLISMFDACVQ